MDKSAKLILQLVDQVSAPSAKIRAELSHLQATTNRFSKTGGITRAMGMPTPVEQRRVTALAKTFQTGPAAGRGAAQAIAAQERGVRAGTKAIVQQQAAWGNATTGMMAYARGMLPIAGPLAGGLAIQKTISAAADFEAALTGIQKKAGTTAEETARLGEEIKSLSSSGNLGVSIDEILGAYDRGAAAGLPLDQLKEFAILSAKAADAFEMSSEDVGNAAAGFKTSFKIDTAEVSKLFDVINKLADSGISDEKDIVSFLDRSGANLNLFGQSKEEAAALGATLLNLKMPAEVAARAMNTLTSKMLAPGSKKSEKSFAALVKDTGKFTKLLQTDPNNAILDLLDKVNAMDKFDATQYLNGWLGQGFSDEVLRLAKGVDEYRRNLKIAADEQSWIGSLDQSYALKLDDFWPQWQIVKNALGELTIDTGTMGMPALKSALVGVKSLIGDIRAGLDKFKITLDVKSLDDAQEAVGALISTVGNLMGMGGKESAIEQFFDRMATSANTVSAGIAIARDALQAVRAGLSYLVGERGEEVVTMGTNSYVTPNHRLQGGDRPATVAGGSPTTNHFHNTFTVNGANDPDAAARKIGNILSSQLNRSKQISLEDRAVI